MPKKIEQLLNKTIYIPYEIIDREIDGSLLLAFEAVSRGWKAIVGSQRNITKYIESNETGIYFLKSITPGQIKLQERIVNTGSLIFSQDAEGLLQRPGFEYKMRFSKASLGLAKKVFFWGEKQKIDFLDACGSEFEAKCAVTGSPRADHWELISNKQKDKSNFKSKYILISTSFGIENHALGVDGPYNLAKDEAGIKNGANSIEEFNKYFKATCGIEVFLLPYYKKLVLELSKNFPNEKIILRPHPSEGLKMWKDLISTLDNVEIRSDGSIIDWLCKSKVLIQYGSTCAIQSNILNVPVVTLIPELPKSIKSYDLEDSRKASSVYSNLEDLVVDFRKFLKDGSGLLPVDKDFIDKLIFSRRTVDSSKKIIDSIEKIYEDSKSIKRIKLVKRFRYNFDTLKRNIGLVLSLIPFWQKFAPKKYRHISLKSFLYYKKRKQPLLSLEEFIDRMNSLRKLSSFTKNIKVKIYRENVFTLFLEE